jgi:hypothetical protein
MARELSASSVEIADEIIEEGDEFDIEQKNAYNSIKSFFNKILDWSVVVFGINNTLDLSNPRYEVLLIISFILVVLAIGLKIFLLCNRRRLLKYLKSARITDFVLLMVDRIAVFITFHFIAVLKPLILYEPSDREIFWVIFFIAISVYIEFSPEFFAFFKKKIKKKF